jgi:hypothetical protein
MILNKGKVPFLTHDGMTFLTDINVDQVYNFEPHAHQDYWLIQFLDAHNVTEDRLEVAVPEEIRQKIRNKEVTLILGNQLEAFHATVEVAYEKFVVGMNLPEDFVILFTSCLNIWPVIVDTAKKYNKEPIRAANVRVYEFTSAMVERHEIKSTPIDKTNMTFDKKYICLNRRWRPHRPALVAMLACKDLLKHGYVSLADCEEWGWHTVYDNLEQMVKDEEFATLFKDNKELICNLPPMYVDTTTQNGITDALTHNLKSFYDKTYFSVVTETPFFTLPGFDPNIHLSEKTFKVVTQRHPFLLLNTPHALGSFHNLGYKSFGEYIDQSYDGESDDGRRLMKIVNEIERLCKLEGDNLKDWIKGTSEICEYNYNHLMDGIDRPGRYTLTIN